MKLEVFFDYACPYCFTGLGYLRKLIPGYGEIEIVWQPCEAHPRPERYGIHSDLAIQGLYYAIEHGFDAWAYHDRIFKAVFEERLDIESINVLSGCAKDLGIDADGYKSALKTGKYAKIQKDNNRYAWGINGLFAVPSYKMNGKYLKSRDGCPVSENELARFLTGSKQ